MKNGRARRRQGAGARGGERRGGSVARENRYGAALNAKGRME
jgi:hypothetical protein